MFSDSLLSISSDVSFCFPSEQLQFFRKEAPFKSAEGLYCMFSTFFVTWFESVFQVTWRPGCCHQPKLFFNPQVPARSFLSLFFFFQCARQPLYWVNPIYSKHVNMQTIMHYADLNPSGTISAFFVVMKETVTGEMRALKRTLYAVDLGWALLDRSHIQ